jgi:hypothetical protein
MLFRVYEDALVTSPGPSSTDGGTAVGERWPSRLVETPRQIKEGARRHAARDR